MTEKLTFDNLMRADLPEHLKKFIPEWIENLSIIQCGEAYLIEKPNRQYKGIFNNATMAVAEEQDNNWFLSDMHAVNKEKIRLSQDDHKLIGFYVFNKIESFLISKFRNIKFQLLMTMQTEDDWCESKIYLEKFRSEHPLFPEKKPFQFISLITSPDGVEEKTLIWQKTVN